MLEGHASIQRDFNRLEKWADRNTVEFKKEKCRVLHPDRRSSWNQDMLGPPSWKAALQGRTCGCGGDHSGHKSALYPCHKEG